jgi:integrase
VCGAVVVFVVVGCWCFCSLPFVSSPLGRFSLLHQKIKPVSQGKYVGGLRFFLEYLQLEGVMELAFEVPEVLDEFLAEYFSELFLKFDGKYRSRAANALYGCLWALPRFKGKLPLADTALTAWSRLVPPVPHPPMSWGLALVVAANLARFVALEVGVAVLLAFVCYLRIGELCSIRVSDVAVPGDFRLSEDDASLAILLPKTKTGPNKWVTVWNLEVAELAKVCMRGKAPGALLFNMSPTEFREHFKASCKGFGLSPAYVPHSLRHGGATRDFIRGFTLEQIMELGRWASAKSARHYLQQGRALLLAIEVPVAVQDMAAVMSGERLAVCLGAV